MRPVSFARLLFSPLFLAASLAGCGRGTFDVLTPTESEAGVRGQDTGVFPPRPEGGVATDSGVLGHPDVGRAGGPDVSTVRDIGFADTGVPNCTFDCDCPFTEACLGGYCMIANRNNECCTNPICPAGQFCVQPNGAPSQCPGVPDSGFSDVGPGPQCQNDCDCPPSSGCVNGQCFANMSARPNLCCFDQPCPPGAFCELPGGGTSTCQNGLPNDGGIILTDGSFFDGSSSPDVDAGPPDTGVVIVPVGAPCNPGMQSCTVDGFCIDQSQGFPGGYCSEDCSRMMCPANATCFDVGMMNRICLEDCMVPADCRMGYGCVRLGINPQPVCWPIPPASMNPMGSPVGSGCMGDNDCMSGLQCLQVPGGGFPGGYCTRVYCDPNTNPCPASSECYAFPGLFSLCLAECPSGGSQSTCRPGYYCLGPTGQPGVCINQ